MSILSDVFETACDYASQTLTAGAMAANMAVGSPELVDRAAVSAMSLEAISGVQAGPGMQTSLSPEITANLTVNPATMPWTAKAEMSAAELNSPSPFKTA